VRIWGRGALKLPGLAGSSLVLHSCEREVEKAYDDGERY